MGMEHKADSAICKEEWKKMESEVYRRNTLLLVSCSFLSDSLWPPWTSPPGSSFHGIILARILDWVAIPSSRGIFPTQWFNLGLQNCRQILYHLSHQARSVIKNRAVLLLMNFMQDELGEKRRQEIVPSRQKYKWVWPLVIWKEQTIGHSAMVTRISMSSRQKEIDQGLPWCSSR